MLRWPFGLEAKRLRLLREAPAGPLRNYLEAPFPDKRQPITETPLLAMDFETTGLDPQQDHLLSVGYVQIQRGRVALRTARHRIIRSKRAMQGQNVAIHRITDDLVAAGAPLEEIIAELLQQLRGRVLLAHHARVEVTFLQQACKTLYGMAPVMPVIDTMQLAQRGFKQRHQPIESGSLRLFNLRERHGLPRYRAHNALCDAIATAELFLVQVANSYRRKPPPLKNFLLRA
ncbi:MAG TPA: hypothetical protein EYP90_10875 [Chromatiaceae bacterium]|nr:hypothetical protein [Chromatiaceae bacterium]